MLICPLLMWDNNRYNKFSKLWIIEYSTTSRLVRSFCLNILPEAKPKVNCYCYIEGTSQTVSIASCILSQALFTVHYLPSKQADLSLAPNKHLV